MMNQVKMKFNTLPEDEQEEIVRRRLICSQCPLMSVNYKEDPSEYIKLYGKEYNDPTREEPHCTVCLCPTDRKTSSLTSPCGLEEYNKKFPNNKQELKFKEYKNEQ
jgi:hypothetical protein